MRRRWSSLRAWATSPLFVPWLSVGASPAPRIVNPRNGQTFAWLLERVEDVHGNWTAYHDDLGSSPGVAYLSRIEYAQAGSPANRSLDLQLDRAPRLG